MAALSTEVPVGVVGAGTMGAGIAQVAATAGHPVLLCDAAAGAAEAARSRIGAALDRAVGQGRLSSAQRPVISARIEACHGLDALASAGLVIEAIVEDLDAKQRLFEALEVFLEPTAILASNTSSLSITALAAKLQHPERVVGLHFFNPAPRMELVEVVRGLMTAPAVVATAWATVEAWGKTPVEVRSTPGFIVNRVARPFYGEALRALAEGAAEVATIDAVMREAGGFRMGPFELIDLIGLDVNLAVSRSIHAACHYDPRYAPSLIQREMVDAGRLGRKAGRGFYDHAADAEPPAPATAAPAPPPRSVVVEGELGVAEPLLERLAGSGVAVERRSGEGLIRLGDLRLVLTDGRSATEWSHMLDRPVATFDLAHDYASCARLAVATADQTSPAQLQSAIGLLQAAGIAVSVLDDLPGLLVMRTVAMLANEAAETVQAGAATAAAVDTAMRLGVNYPQGPLAWAEKIGLKRVLEVLDHLRRSYSEERYRASWMLRRKVMAKGRFHG
ncbi:MAG TPA: 3-hydroxyacyl-CoA dehydrogenase [Geminicoccaceae bacterium]|nr:3-hydroxyacyl-CoA dehydrogenase [Geminicoccaceae bacterium]